MTSPTPREAIPALREDSIWAAGHPKAAQALPYAAPVLSAEDQYLANLRAKQTQDQAVDLTPKP